MIGEDVLVWCDRSEVVWETMNGMNGKCEERVKCTKDVSGARKNVCVW